MVTPINKCVPLKNFMKTKFQKFYFEWNILQSKYIKYIKNYLLPNSVTKNMNI